MERFWSVVLLLPLIISLLLSVLNVYGGFVRSDWIYIVFGFLDVILWGIAIWAFIDGHYFGKDLICDSASPTQFVVIHTKPNDVYIDLGYENIRVPNGIMVEELPVGEYEAVITPISTDYKPMIQSFKLEPNNKTTIYIELKESNPSYPVSIETNGQALSIDNGPLINIKGGSYFCKLKAGKHTVDITSTKHKPSHHEITVTRYDSSQKFSLPVGELMVGRLKIVSRIQGLVVIVDDRSIGTAPIILNTLPVGQHEIKFSKNYTCALKDIIIEEGKEYLIDVDSEFPQETRHWN